MAWTRRPDILPLAADYAILPEPESGWPLATYYTQRWAEDLLALRTHPIWQLALPHLSQRMIDLIESEDGRQLVFWEVADAPRGNPFALIINPAPPSALGLGVDVAGWIRFRPGIETNLVLVRDVMWVCGGGKRDHVALRALAAMRNRQDPFGRPVGPFSPEPDERPQPPEDDMALSTLAP